MNRNQKKWIALILASWAGVMDALPANCTKNMPKKCGGNDKGTAIKYCKLEWVDVPVPVGEGAWDIPVPLPDMDFCKYIEKEGFVDSCAQGTALNNKCGKLQTVECTATRENTGPCCGLEPGKWKWDSNYNVKVTLWSGTACPAESESGK